MKKHTHTHGKPGEKNRQPPGHLPKVLRRWKILGRGGWEWTSRPLPKTDRNFHTRMYGFRDSDFFLGWYIFYGQIFIHLHSPGLQIIRFFWGGWSMLIRQPCRWPGSLLGGRSRCILYELYCVNGSFLVCLRHLIIRYKSHQAEKHKSHICCLLRNNFWNICYWSLIVPKMAQREFWLLEFSKFEIVSLSF